ncbi:MAG: SDR family oxidoreductase [Bacteroidales bacterium]|jgi:farnesol dehydrogenase|nr:SDR family oxidoreductase [Bacteroidales bacterium]MDX9905575.1 SDR family oxidoreductase [Bacteroidales bacterium]
MKCFITGISGFIGASLAEQLTANGHSVNALVRNPEKVSTANHPGVRYFKGDLFDNLVLLQAMEGCDTVFHLAAFAKPWSKDPAYPHRVNVEGAVNVFEAAFKAGVKKVVFTSSAATMSPSDGDLSVDEDTQRTIPYFNAYETTKAEAESKAREYCGRGLPVIIVNPSRVYGPGPLNPSNSTTKMMIGYKSGKWRIIPGDGSKIGNYVYIDDVVRGHILAAEKGRAGERYILGGENVTFDDFFGILANVSGNRRKMVHLPVPVMAGVARAMQWQARFTGIPPLITEDFVLKYLNDWCLSSAKAEQELGYHITPLAQGVRKTLEWDFMQKVD